MRDNGTGSTEISFGDDRIQLTRDIVPAVREILSRGLPDSFMRTSVRVESHTLIGGGMKADLVGELKVKLAAVLKIGDRELEEHHALMTKVNEVAPRTFVDLVGGIRKLPGDRRLMLMALLGKHETLLNRIYLMPSSDEQLMGIVNTTVEKLQGIWRTGMVLASSDNCPFPTNPGAIGARIEANLAIVLRRDVELGCIWENPGRVAGQSCPPLRQLVAEAVAWLSASSLEPEHLRLAHGDLHAGNILTRGRGKGFSVRLIDPNPRIGFADPVYDLGKLLHWSEPVGWAKVAPAKCTVAWFSPAPGHDWELAPSYDGVPAAAEARRRSVHQFVLTKAKSLAPVLGPNWARRLSLSVASAHTGMARLGAERGDFCMSRFAASYGILSLLEWRKALG